ncbi:alkyl hydroperoxide reductase [Nonlabens ponticola]|uniref:Alkyl hydroperoxide reductase n=2 Tax=Nonlabens ponticola TaxID=2496866 RepID=A0A3S9N150_9FLAO|nr:alkyl hydroperoxide reductase [Nonlabens ponticola]
MSLTLKLAAIYNILWGAWVVIFPDMFWDLVGMERLNQPMVWQGMGMVIGVYGLGYWWASYNPMRHWPIVAVGMLGKIFGPLGFVFNHAQGKVPFEFIYTLITNDFIWWIPFFLILKKVHTDYQWKLN